MKSLHPYVHAYKARVCLQSAINIYPVGNKFRYTITLECSGVSFCGCQRQAEAWSVHQLIEEAVYIFSKENVLVTAAGGEDTSLNAHHLQT